MAYHINLFSPETYTAFLNSNRDISGFRQAQENAASRVKPGDFLICYVTRLSRWIGVLEVLEGPFVDSTPIFVEEPDPYVLRFRVKTLSWLSFEQAIPIHDKALWQALSFTKKLPERSLAWTGKVRSSLNQLDDADGKYLQDRITAQQTNNQLFPLTEQEKKKLSTLTIVRDDKLIPVTVPEDTAAEENTLDDSTADPSANEPSPPRESILMQAALAAIGEKMGMAIWLPKADRGLVLQHWKPADGVLLQRLPLNYDDITLRTVEQIDVLWLRRRSIVRAFEVEHTTSVYSGILRMADLLALQPNMDIKLHIVAPDAKREKVFQEIRRPVFSLLDRGPLAESCSFLSYDSIQKLGNQEHLSHLSASVLDEYAEDAE